MATAWMLQTLLKYFSRHKALFCYLVFLWGVGTIIFALLSHWTKDYIPQYPEVRPMPAKYHFALSINHHKLSKPIKYCSLPQTITLGQEGKGPKGDQLEGVIIITRHGDRGALHDLVNQSLVTCAVNLSVNSDLVRYINVMKSKEKERAKSDPFRNFPLLPSFAGSCLLGQLSSQGLVQMLQLGRLLRQVYVKQLHLISDLSLLEDVSVYSTAVPRTYQSALALLFTFLPSYPAANNIRKGSGFSFCNSKKYCDCPVLEKIDKLVHKEKWTHLMSHPAVQELIRSLKSLTGTVSDQDGGQPDNLFDSLMVYVCHQQPLPCQKNGVCATVDQLNNLMAFVDWSGKQTANLGLYRRASRLRIHGFLSDVVKKLADMTHRKEKKKNPRVIVFSAHDLTLIAVMSALGFYDGTKIPYASRLIFELYNSPDRKLPHVRIVYNGRDMTKRAPLCRHSQFKFNQTHSNFICSLRNFEDYVNRNFYKELNVASFQQACSQLPPTTSKLKKLKPIRSVQPNAAFQRE